MTPEEKKELNKHINAIGKILYKQTNLLKNLPKKIEPSKKAVALISNKSIITPNSAKTEITSLERANTSWVLSGFKPAICCEIIITTKSLATAPVSENTNRYKAETPTTIATMLQNNLEFCLTTWLMPMQLDLNP